MNIEHESDDTPSEVSRKSLTESFIKLHGEGLPKDAQESLREFLTEGSHSWLAGEIQYGVSFGLIKQAQTPDARRHHNNRQMRIVIPERQEEYVFVWDATSNEWHDESPIRPPSTQPDI